MKSGIAGAIPDCPARVCGKRFSTHLSSSLSRPQTDPADETSAFAQRASPGHRHDAMRTGVASRERFTFWDFCSGATQATRPAHGSRTQYVRYGQLAPCTTLRCMVASCADFLETAGMTRPNILLIIADGMQAEAVDPGHACLTPSLDALAQRGVRFRRAHTTCPTCSPSHSRQRCRPSYRSWRPSTSRSSRPLTSGARFLAACTSASCA